MGQDGVWSLYPAMRREEPAVTHQGDLGRGHGSPKTAAYSYAERKWGATTWMIPQGETIGWGPVSEGSGKRRVEAEVQVIGIELLFLTE